ncbi:hypothetical protein [Cupriavidus numazuensis]|uniref:Lysis protein n=1 Tax=Cupriavidus numazuensis TaxID=221992 RepID=A0ABM8T9W4_9BURK|nr:hypothetical protein [Cupriavidus numazuensis]CAG2129052.1 hypothetical protein LMG26411_00109 [Cupriavidus numazuensis]
MASLKALLAELAGYVLVAALAAVLGGLAAGAWQGNRYQAQLATLRADHTEALAAAEREARMATERYREAERNAGLARDNIWAQARKESDAENQTVVAELAALRAGARRLSLPVRACAPGPGDVPADAAATGGAGAARAELTAEAGAALVGIVADGNAGIRDANTCIGIYNAVRDRLNAASE